MSQADVQNFGSYDDAIAAMDKLEQEGQTRANEMTLKKQTFTDSKDKMKTQRDLKTTTIRYGTGGTTKKVEPLGEFKGFEPEIKGREDRIAELQAELDALEVLERPTFDTIERTRQIYGDKFMGPRRRLRGPQRTETQPVDQPVDQPAQQPQIRQRADGLFPQGKNMPLGEQKSDGLFPAGGQMSRLRQPVDTFEGEEEVIQAPAQTRPNQGNMDALRQAEMDTLDFQFQPSTPEVTTQPRFNPLRPPAQPVDTFEGEQEVIQAPVRPPPAQFNFQPTSVSNVTGSQPSVIQPVEGQRFVENMILGFDPDKQESVDYTQEFEEVKFGTPQQKQMRAMQLLGEAAEKHGPTSPEFKKAKSIILLELTKINDPARFRKQRQVERIMDENPNNYGALTKAVPGITEADAKTVAQLFPISNDMKAIDIDDLYQNAKQQITQTMTGRKRKKALELLELQYMAVIDNVTGG